MLRVARDTIGTYLAKAQTKIAERYSGEAGARRLREQGYPPEMIETMKGAGVRTFKYRPGMALLGLIGKIGFGRMANSNLAHLDAYIRRWDRTRRWAGGRGRATPGTGTNPRMIPSGTGPRLRTLTIPTCASRSCM